MSDALPRMPQKIDFSFACQDDCLSQMIPSDLRRLVTERDLAVERAGVLEKAFKAAAAELDALRAENARLRAALEAAEMGKDGAYLERNRCVALIARMAVSMGLPVAVTRTAIEGWSADWHGCIYIGLPTGQVSWHFHDSQAHLFDGLPTTPEAWDGHDTPEKYRRVDSAFRTTHREALDG